MLFLSPAPLNELPAWLEKNPGPIRLTGASATSSALLRVLWSQRWELPPVSWSEVPPGAGLDTGRPFLEIGNAALRHFILPPPGYHIYDLASEWTAWTGLPFVFAVWIVRRALNDTAAALLERLNRHISRITASLPEHFDTLSRQPYRPDWLPAPSLIRYWQAMSYGLGAREQAALLLFGECYTRQGLLPACRRNGVRSSRILRIHHFYAIIVAKGSSVRCTCNILIVLRKSGTPSVEEISFGLA